MRRTARVLLAGAVGLGLLVEGDAGAGAPTDQLKVQIERVLKAMDNPELAKPDKVKERRGEVRQLANEFFDFGETAKRSLGRHWQARTPAEREEFVRLFADLLERTYIRRIEGYGGEKIVYAGDTVDGDQATVRTRIVAKAGSEIPVEYRMLRRGERWLVYDVVIEGISLISNYRSQFNKIIQTGSFQDLVNKMKSRQEEFIEQDRQPKRTSRVP
jgi:phospholipid transport system substrate-binding protein